VGIKSKISVITVCKNAAPFIRACIESVVFQPYPNVEYIIIDGGSTDGTIDIINEYKDRISHLVCEEDGSPNEALNKGFKLATGDILCWLNSDDQFWPDALNVVAKVFEDMSEVKWITGFPTWYTPDGGFVNEPYIQDNIMFHSLLHDGLYKKFYRWSQEKVLSGDFLSIQQESVFWKRELWEKAGANVSGSGIAFDFELWLRFFQFECLYSVPAPLSGFRVRNNQISSNHERYVAECNDLVRHHLNQSSWFERVLFYIRGLILKFLKPFYLFDIPLLRTCYVYLANLSPLLIYNEQKDRFEFES
jgi:glycosyltransferase involved in cell wall biosynthesis